MTGYFDEATREISSYAEAHRNAPEAFLEALVVVEERVISDVNLCTGDREFPADLREAIQRDIAIYRVKSITPVLPQTEAREMALCTWSSELIERLHSRFHELGRRRLKLRFGLVQDSPRQFLMSRVSWLADGEPYAHGLWPRKSE